MPRFLVLLLTLATALSAQLPTREVQVLLALGAPGSNEYAPLFQAQVTAWKQACEKAGLTLQIIGQDTPAKDAPSDLAQLTTALQQACTKSTGQLWLVLIGHGTFDGREAKFNLRGPDLSARQLAEELKPLTQELILIHTASASAGFLPPLIGKNRVLISATKGPDEVFYTRFGEHFAPAIAGLPEADLDQDRQVSLLEAFLHASHQTAEFYEKEGRLATEHALLEDNADGQGTRAEAFVGVQAQSPQSDGARAAQIALVLTEEEQKLTEAQRLKRDTLERALEALKTQREKLGEDRYYTDLEKLLRELAEVYR
ncbi:hypothetical protein GCM10023213_36410 [Prosthecobacter algae]|uniref:Caspase domain-containing protein n=1 Tax=Prosthecobacter algae TaxID=1144682 RepID=A0ABP9PEA3_9BACT